ncbi:MAG: hypothetical protein EBY40_08050 [Marivivens sp.]|jgi:hypothetical protein|uniref:hypothetical protein n=1 Tax=Marivivens sp. TaxID=1978374 RepID=UPI0025C13489|nr:hypothetical protein [Marivivens sp.]NBT52595.1 hypothetical protein [Marivivens sp.]NCW70071.1 hypothetical protein [Marivivens sp.]NDH03064.1 hypothetical protein [Marivivens sp.]
MHKFLLTSALLTALAACGGSGTNPFQRAEVDTGTGTGADEESTLFASINNNLNQVSYNSTNGTLKVDIYALDGPNTLVEYDRTPALDLPGFYAYTYQDDPLDRHFTAFVAQDLAQTVEAVVVGDGGQFDAYFAGASFKTLQGFVNPSVSYSETENGLVSYAGQYVAVTNIASDGQQLLLIPDDYDVTEKMAPRQALTIRGDVFVDVSFKENAINGTIRNRVFGNDPRDQESYLAIQDGLVLDEIVLYETSIDESGQFVGTVFDDIQQSIGNYGGVIGGALAQGIAGGTNLDIGAKIDLPGAMEHGVFILNLCGLTSQDQICEIVNPDYGN